MWRSRCSGMTAWPTMRSSNSASDSCTTPRTATSTGARWSTPGVPTSPGTLFRSKGTCPPEGVAEPDRVSAFVLPDEYVELRASLRRLAEDHIAPNAADADENEQYPWASWNAWRDAGFAGLAFPEKF